MPHLVTHGFPGASASLSVKWDHSYLVVRAGKRMSGYRGGRAAGRSVSRKTGVSRVSESELCRLRGVFSVLRNCGMEEDGEEGRG